MKDLYGTLEAAGCTTKHRNGDLFVLVTPEADAIVKASGVEFHHILNGDKTWMHVSFLYWDPPV